MEMISDGDNVRAHQQAAHGPQKKGPDQALGRSRGGLTTKIHLPAAARAALSPKSP